MLFKCTVRLYENIMLVNYIIYNFLYDVYIFKGILQVIVGNRVWFFYKLYEYVLKFVFFFNYVKYCVLWVFFYNYSIYVK